MTGQFLERASEVFSARGFEAWEVFLVEKRSDLVEVADGRVRRSHSALDRGCGLRGLLEGREGYASTTRMHGDGLSECADALVTSALCGSPGGTLPLPAHGPPQERFEAYDPSVEDLTPKKLGSLAVEGASRALAEQGRGGRLRECHWQLGSGSNLHKKQPRPGRPFPVFKGLPSAGVRSLRG